MSFRLSISIAGQPPLVDEPIRSAITLHFERVTQYVSPRRKCDIISATVAHARALASGILCGNAGASMAQAIPRVDFFLLS